MIRSEHIVNVGPYQHVAVTIEGNDLDHYLREMAAYQDHVKVKAATFQAELESWIVPVRKDLLEGITNEAVAELQKLGATVISETPAATPEPETRPEVEPSGKAPWERQNKPASKPKAWEEKGSDGFGDF